MKISTVSKVDEDEDGARAGGGGSHVGVAKSVGEAGPGDDNSSAVLTTPIRTFGQITISAMSSSNAI